MDDYKDFKTENDDRDEWADEFFSSVLSGTGGRKPKSGLYGQFDVIDRMAKGMAPDDDSDDTPKTGVKQEKASGQGAAGDGNNGAAPLKTAGLIHDDSGVSEVHISDREVNINHIGASLFGNAGTGDNSGAAASTGTSGTAASGTAASGMSAGAGTAAGTGSETGTGTASRPYTSAASASPAAPASYSSSDTAASGTSAPGTSATPGTSANPVTSAAPGTSADRGSSSGTYGADPGASDKAENDGKGNGLFTLIAVLAIVLLLILAAVCGFFIGKIAGNASTGEKGYSVDFAYEEVDSRQVAKLQTIYRFICDNYYEQVDADELLEGAVRGMSEALGDPYGSYYRPGRMTDYTDFVDGRYNGVGIEILQQDGRIFVTDVTDDSPAFRAGFSVGDEIAEVNGRPVPSIGIDELKTVFSSVGTAFTCLLRNESGDRTVSCTPEAILRKTVHMERKEDGLVYIKIDQFIGGTADEFKNALKQASEEVVSGFIVDLRDNPGGFVSEAVMVSDIILPEGTVAFAKQRDGVVVRSYNSDGNFIDAPIVLLVNGRTASSAELLAGAFRDFEAGAIVGTKTYGKALAQITYEFDFDGSGIVLSAYKYYTPSGECIDGAGIDPTVEIVLPKSFASMSVNDIPEGEDLQYMKAVELVMSHYPEG